MLQVTAHSSGTRVHPIIR